MDSSTDSNEISKQGLSFQTRNRWLISLALLVHLGLGCHTAWVMSPTHDEYWHLPLGVASWQQGRFDIEILNPPGLRMWAAIPVFPFANSLEVAGLKNADGTIVGDLFLEAHSQSYRRHFFLGRVMILTLSVGTGLLLVCWSREWFGETAAVITVWLWCFSPTVLAHASLVTTDAGTAFFFTLSLYLCWKFARTPDLKQAALFGGVMGLAQLAKFTSVLLVPLAFSIWFLTRWRSEELSPLSFKTGTKRWALAVGVGLLVLNVGYLFEESFSPLTAFDFQSESMKTISAVAGPLRNVPLPVPGTWLRGIDRQKQIMEAQHPTFLDGQWSLTGFRAYFLKAMIYKLPHATHLLGMLAMIFLCIPGSQTRDLRKQAMLLLPVFVLLFIASQSSMQLGIRYLLPVFPFLFLFVGQVGRWYLPAEHRTRSLAVLISALLLLTGLAQHPHHLAYFNEWAGGPQTGRQHLIDSNLDWGQDLWALKECLDKRDNPEIGLAYFGTIPPAKVGIDYHLCPQGIPEAGLHAVSVNFLAGRPHGLRDRQGHTVIAGPGAFRYFQLFEPVARAGTSLEVYDLSDADIARWRAAVRGF